jgi:hypothetical protein
MITVTREDVLRVLLAAVATFLFEGVFYGVVFSRYWQRLVDSYKRGAAFPKLG